MGQPATTPDSPPIQACLVVICGPEPGRRINIRDSLTLGRSTLADVQIDEESISRRHARLHCAKGRIVLRDLASTNGTYVNECAVSERMLAHGDLLRVGKAVFRLLCGKSMELAYQEEVRRLAIQDGLTQAANRRHFLEVLYREIARASRYHRQISLLLFEPAQYPGLRIQHGELAVDCLLRQLGSVVRGKIRGEDLLGRLGEVRFGVLLPETPAESAWRCAGKLAALVEGTPFSFAGSTISVTLAMGAAGWSEGQSGPDLLARAASDLEASVARRAAQR